MNYLYLGLFYSIFLFHIPLFRVSSGRHWRTESKVVTGPQETFAAELKKGTQASEGRTPAKLS